MKSECQLSYEEYHHQRHPSRPHPKLNVSAQPYTPHNTPTAITNSAEPEPLIQLLARRDVVSSILYEFDDRPESYRAWHSSFISATGRLGLTPTEELDLLTEWLGKVW